VHRALCGWPLFTLSQVLTVAPRQTSQHRRFTGGSTIATDAVCTRSDGLRSCPPLPFHLPHPLGSDTTPPSRRKRKLKRKIVSAMLKYATIRATFHIEAGAHNPTGELKTLYTHSSWLDCRSTRIALLRCQLHHSNHTNATTPNLYPEYFT